MDEASGVESTTPILTIEGPVATVRLNRPRHLNRIEPDDLAVLAETFARVEADPALRVLVLTGTGRAFSAGYHLGDLATRGASDAAEAAPSVFERVTDQLENLELPTICRLNGGVYGGSTDLALACDFRIGVEGSEMFMPAARLGLHYYPGGLVRYAARLGQAAAKRLFLTAERIDAAEMLRIGYLDAVVPVDALDGRVAALAGTLAANAPRAVRGMKRALNEIARGAFDAAAAGERHRESLRGDEVREGMRAFAEKRPPVFADG